MKDRPILFSGQMVRALLAGEKTQTRRVLAKQPQPNGGKGLHPVAPYQTPSGMWTWVLAATGHGNGGGNEFLCPYGQPGEMLWVRECFSYGFSVDKDVERRHLITPWFWADGNPEQGDYAKPRPSIHMPRWASRTTLEITGVRVERLNSISEMDAYHEGIDVEGEPYLAAESAKSAGVNCPPASVCAYADLWDSINGSGAWHVNPWVWVVEFKVHQKNVDYFIESMTKGAAA